jgi:hypothetical protein
VNCLSENFFEPEGGETRTMKKLTLITAALALLGGASIAGAANQTPNRQKLSPRKLRRPKQNAADKEVAARRPNGHYCSSGQPALLFATFFNQAAQILGLVR